MKKQIEPIEEETQEKTQTYFENDPDVIKHISTIHSKKTTFSEDYVLARTSNDPKIQKFIQEHHKLAGIFKEFIQDEETAKEIANGLIQECNGIVINRRNDPSNWFIDRLLKRNKEEAFTEEEGGIGKAMTGIFGKKKPKKEED